MRKTTIVIGAMGLIGGAVSKGLIDEGGFVILSDINPSIHDFGRDMIGLEGDRRVFTNHLDITDEKNLLDLIQFAKVNDLEIDGVVNLSYPKRKNWGLPLNEVTYEIFCENINPHLGGYFNVMKIFSDYFSRLGGGSIINLASIYGFLPPKFEIYQGTELSMPVEYAAIKSAIIHLSKFFAQKYKKSNVRVNAISPGGVYSSQAKIFIEQYRLHAGQVGLLNPEDLVPVVMFLLNEKNRAITGQNICVDDGFSL